MKSARPILLLTLFLLHSAFIVTRDDRNDSDYLDLAGNYPAVCKVGERGGDGTLIASQWIITAAHVAQGMEQRHGANLLIFFQGISEGYPVDKVVVHPEFVPMGDHDIALIRLKEPVEAFKPAGLYRESDEKGKDIVIVGHGDFKTGIEKVWKSDGKKRAATNRIESVTDNHIIFYFDKPSADGCTNLEGTAGRGDSGGPAFISRNGVSLVAGISSAGSPGENGPGTYGAVEHYTRISTHLKWIDGILSGKSDGITKPAIPQRPLVLEGLGLFLRQGDKRIDIEGKIDPEVPKEFRDVRFGPPPVFIVALNEKDYDSLDAFARDFASIKKGSRYTIEFSVRGKREKFETTR